MNFLEQMNSVLLSIDNFVASLATVITNALRAGTKLFLGDYNHSSEMYSNLRILQEGYTRIHSIFNNELAFSAFCCAADGS